MNPSNPLIDNQYHEASSPVALVVKYTLQPIILVGVVAIWLTQPDHPLLFPGVVIAVQLILGLLERRLPARPGWLIRGREMALNLFLVFILSSAGAAVGVAYAQLLAAPLDGLRQSLHLDIWPHHWPLLVQMLMVFLSSEFIWYWLHRAEHRWQPVWRFSGHGAHHSFKRLGALNFGLNHPFELFLLVLPAALIELTFGVGVAVAGATVLGVVQASIAHANLDLNSKWIGLLFTTNGYHIRHHSSVLEQSNTNYGCSAIIWDRIFGTFGDSRTADAGIGPTEPTLWEKFLMPIREPRDSRIAPRA